MEIKMLPIESGRLVLNLIDDSGRMTGRTLDITAQQWKDLQAVVEHRPTTREAALYGMLKLIVADAGACDDQCDSVSKHLIQQAREWLEDDL